MRSLLSLLRPEPDPSPPPQPPLGDRAHLTASATQLAARIRSGQVSSAEVVEAHIRYVQAVNPRLNAMVHDRFELARREAQAADEALAARGPEAVGPLHGVPCTIKESFALEGMPQTAGLVARRGVVSPGDAVTVRRLRDAGAIPLGVTNTPELCMWYETHNHIYGRTNNAYDPRRICGGSSGGEGAIVGAGASPFGLGSDIGGSIRMPAFFNGVFGHKPSSGLVPSTGQFPISHGRARSYLCTGPLCRRAEDLEMLVRALAGPDGEDPACRAGATLGRVAEVDVSALRVFSVETSGFIDPTPQVRDGVRRAAHALGCRGARVEALEIEALRRSLDIWSAMLGAAGGPSFGEILGQGEPISVSRELWRWLWQRTPHTLPALILAMVEQITERFEGRIGQALEEGMDLREQLDELLGADGVLLYPTFPSVAPRHFEPLLRPIHFIYTAIFNVLELPATQVPLGLGVEGLPLGVQVVAGHGQDHLAMAVACALEDVFGGWVPPWEGGAR